MESSASSCGGQSTSNSPAHQPPVDAKKRHKMDAPSKKGDERDTALALPPEGWASSASPSQAEIEITMDSLPTCILSHVGSFTAGISLGGLCKATLEAFPALQYNINIASSASSFGGEEDPAGTKSEQHMGLPPTPGALATGRVISRISVTGCTDRKDSKGGYLALEIAVRRVVRHSTPTLQSILVHGSRGKDSGRVAAIIGELVPVSLKRRRAAKKLTRVELCHGANGIVKAGNAIEAGLWPSLEELVIQHCHANVNHMKRLAVGLRSGQAPNLRVLNWDRQAFSKDGVDDVMLAALSAGKCPRIEHVSFTDNYFCSEYSQRYLRGALRACPELRELRMDCTYTPSDQVRDLIEALQAGDAPRLTSLCIQAPDSLDGVVGFDALMDIARSRTPTVILDVGCVAAW